MMGKMKIVKNVSAQPANATAYGHARGSLIELVAKIPGEASTDLLSVFPLPR